MAYHLSDIYLFSDFDGTIHSATQGIPPQNIEALHRFVKKGGHFSLATSRSPKSAKAFLDQLPINAPCLCVNGGAVYDMDTDTYLYTCFLPEQSQQIMMDILTAFPELDASVLTEVDNYYVADHRHAAGRMQLSNYTVSQHFAQPLQGRWFKAVLNTPGEDAVEYMEKLNQRGYEGVRFTISDSYFIEMLPEQSSKGAAVHAMCQKLHLDPKQTVAVGDYYNDIEMFQEVGFAACVAGAPAYVKQFADHILCTCEEGAIAELIALLEERYEND